MPSITTLFEDTSPVLVYSNPGWRAGSSGDSSADEYTQSSFTVTQASGATMSFAFYGSSVSVIGSRRGNHGEYMGSIDNFGPSTHNGSATPDQFTQVLYDADFSLGHHELTITNNQDTFFDVDYVTVESSIGLDNEDLIVNMFQASHPAFTYTPPSSWKNPSVLSGMFVGGSGRATTDSSAMANFTFQHHHWAGDAVALYGPVGPSSSSSYTVQIDDGDRETFSANKEFYRPQQILFFAENLGGGQHSLQIQALQGSTAVEELAIDFATVYTTRSLGGSFLGVVDSPAPPSPTATHVSRPSIPVGIVVALALAITVAIAASLFSIFLVWRQRRSNRTSGAGASHNPPLEDVRRDPETIQPFVLSNPPRPVQDSAWRTMAHRYNVSSSSLAQSKRAPTPAHQSEPSASGSGILYTGTRISAPGERPSASENTIIILDNSVRVVRDAMDLSDQNYTLRSTAPPPEYTQTSSNH